jgi:hypothetical protein
MAETASSKKTRRRVMAPTTISKLLSFSWESTRQPFQAM